MSTVEELGAFVTREQSAAQDAAERLPRQRTDGNGTAARHRVQQPTGE